MVSRQMQPTVQVLEKGNVVFFYRPKEGVLHPKSPKDVERAYFMLLPDDQQKHKNRLFNVAHGMFPTIVPGIALPEERDWAFVQDVGRDPKDVLQKLQKNIEAQAQPSGQRARPWARVAGEGRYAITKHDDHTHLVYHLREPGKPGEVQKEMQIMPEASYVISVKEPFAPSEIELEDKPSYPDNLRKKFDGHGWIPVDPTSFLDYQWTQILMIGAGKTAQQEFGITLNPDAENKAQKEAFQMLHKEDAKAGEAGISILKPLETGKWE